MQHNKKAFSIIIAISLMLLLWLLAIFLLDYIIPFSRNTKWIENGTKAYYESYKWIENWLYAMRDNDAYFETWSSTVVNSWGSSYSLSSTGAYIPIPWNWNSDFNKDFNTISYSNPISLFLKWNINWNNVKLYFKVPDLDNNVLNIESFSWWITGPIINWQLTSFSWTLNSSGSYIMNTDINQSDSTWIIVNLSLRKWFNLDTSEQTFSSFYANNNCVNTWCVLKLSVVNELYTDTKRLPYLEYMMDFSSAWTLVANYYATINSIWKSYWFKKGIKLDIPEQTTIEAFDFTVFQ